MVVRSRVQTLDRDATLALAADMAPAELSRVAAVFAREQLGLVEAQNAKTLGYVPPHVTFVDGHKDAREDSVRVPGSIVYEFSLQEEVLVYIGELLAQHSPFRSGRYTASHVLYADGEQVDVKTPPPSADEYVFTNLQPYARKIERGESDQAPDGVFEAVAALAMQRFGNQAKIKFTYRSPLHSDSPLESWAKTTDLRRKGRREGDRYRQTWLRRQPAILVTFR